MKLLLEPVLVAMATIVIIGVGFGLRSHTVEANPSKIWVVNDHALQTADGGVCGGVCDPTTAAGRAKFEATLDTVQADSSDTSGHVMVELCSPGCSLPPPAGDTWIFLQTDGSNTGVTLNGRGLTCSVVAPAPDNDVCGGIKPETVDTTDHFIVYQVTNTGSHSCGDIFPVTVIQDAVSLDSQGIVITDGCATPTPTNTPTASATTTSTATSTSTPTPTATFVPPTPAPAITTLTAPANPGDTEIQVASAQGFQIGDLVTINPNGANEESAVVTGFGSLTLDRPLRCAHAAGEFVEAVSPFGSGICSPTPTPTATDTPLPTATASPTATPSPATQGCLTFGQKIRLLIGILRRFGAHQGERRYNPTYDVNHDGVINVDDLMAVLNAPTCHERHGGRAFED